VVTGVLQQKGKGGGEHVRQACVVPALKQPEPAPSRTADQQHSKGVQQGSQQGPKGTNSKSSNKAQSHTCLVTRSILSLPLLLSVVCMLLGA
jgi:hypothetical protein